MNTRIIDAIGRIDEKFLDEALDDNTKSKSRGPLLIGAVCTAAAAVIAGVFIFRAGLTGPVGQYTSDPAYPLITETKDSGGSSNDLPPDTSEIPPESAPTDTSDSPEQSGVPAKPLPYSEFEINYDKLPFEYNASGELPKITSSDIGGGGMGFEGFSANDVSECVDGYNPWNTELDIDELPVFNTRYGAYATWVQATLDKEEAMRKLEDTAAALGGELSDVELDEVELDHYDPTFSDELKGKLLSAKAMVGDTGITIHDLGSIHIEFGSSLQLPEGYGFDSENPDPEKQDRTARYIIEKYPELFGFSNPITYTDFIYQSAFDYSDNAFCAIMNYNFGTVRFYESENQVGIWIDDILADYECGGFYPVISPEVARECLLSGDYVTTVPTEQYLPDGMTEERVEFMELVYHLNSDNSAYIPYYRFLVRIEPNDFSEDGSNHYGAFYVPAVEPEYLENTDTELRFN